tara:strand:+ start:855 stop:1655 length:801 start_codon:yes stop_codon:yes gene_type:complete
MSLGRLLKDIAPVLIGATLGPGIGAQFGASPFISRAVTGALTSKLTGGKTKDALRNALIAGVGGAAFDRFGGAEQAVPQGGEGTIVRSGSTQPTPSNPDIAKKMGVSSVPTEQASQQIAETFKPKTFSAELLKSAGVGGDNLFARLLNTPLGEGLTAGLIAQLLSGGDEDEDTRTEFERRPFGAGGPGGKLGGITFAKEGGEMGFPRRTGGIDPSEGSGTKDDVPAMLMAGEFVLTKDAVKGLGDGDQRKGIQRAYNMMDNLEARA